MGCARSKLDDLPAVTLCRDRREFLDQATKYRFAFAEAHFAYVYSLRQIGGSLKSFIDQNASSSKRKLKPPQQKKRSWRADSTADKEGITHFYPYSDSVSDQGLNVRFGLEAEYGSDGPGSLHNHSGPSSSLHHLDEADGGGYSGLSDKMFQNPGGETPFMGMTYMMSKAPAAAVMYYPKTDNVIYFGDSSSSSHYPYPKPYPSYDYGGGGGAVSQFYGSSQPTSSKPPSSPPSPPKASAWNFLDPFEGYDQYYAAPSQNLKVVSIEEKEKENLPDSEEESDPKSEIVKEVHKDLKYMESSVLKPTIDEYDGEAGDTKASIPVEAERKEYEVHVVEKEVTEADKRTVTGRSFSRKASEAMRDIEAEFARASEAGNEVAKILEVGKLPYKHKHVPLKILDVVPHFKLLESEDEMAMKSGSLSSTLQKLYLWEKKLYSEVKAEEKLRMVHDRKVCQLERLEGGDADTEKVESVRNLIKDMSAKISMAIQVVDKISVMINKIRDGELWPQLKELIQGLARMWKRMLQCHRIQLQVIRETRGLGAIVSSKKLDDDAHLKATQRLQHELVHWTVRFSDWIDAQKSYVNALNNWLLKCLLYEPEETPEGIAPFSPSKIGAPPIFVICNQWSQAIERLSNREVVDSMRKLTMSVLRAWEQDKMELRERVSGDKDMERKVKMMDKEDEKIRKKFRVIERKMGPWDDDEEENSLAVDGNLVYHVDSNRSSLNCSLERIFEAMERFAVDSVKLYEELLRRTKEEEERFNRGNAGKLRSHSELE